MTGLYANCVGCGHARHMHIGAAACQVVKVDGPPSTTDPTPRDPHPGRTVTRCPCPQFRTDTPDGGGTP